MKDEINNELMLAEKAKKFLEEIDQIEIINSIQPVITRFDRLMITIDLQIMIRLAGSDILLNFEILSDGSPQKIRNKLLQMAVVKTNYENSYVIFLAPYLSQEALKICKEHGFGGIDASDNCFFKLGSILIHKIGNKNLLPIKRALGRHFTVKETRVFRVLFSNPTKKWSIKKLSEKTKNSYPHCWKTIEKIKGRSIIEFDKKKFHAKNIQNLTDIWMRAYTAPDVTFCLYSKENIQDIVRKITKFFSAKKTNYAFTKTVAAALLLKNDDLTNIDVYYDGEESDNSLIENLSFTTVPDKNSHQINFIAAVDPAVFWYSHQIINDVTLVSDVQIYLDLMQDGSQSSKDLAQKIFDNRILNAWTK
ncbi:MAG: hypothetical protein HQ534_11425 [Armatimonadetes bacterium]|nr:hypothetical protein [Armatimonadota bacterium]